MQKFSITTMEHQEKLWNSGLMKEKMFSQTLIPPSLEELENRLRKRGTDAEDVIVKRMNKAVSEISHYNEYDYVIINDDFEQSVLNLRSIILANRSSTKNLDQEVKAKFQL